MADNNDTGTGGINLNGELYTFDVVEPNSPDESAGGKQGSWSPGKVNVDKTVKDVSKPTRETFAKYLSNTTLGKPGTSVDLPVRPNPYPVGASDATSLQETKLKDVYGNPLPPGISPNESKFAPEFNQTIGAPAPLPLKKGYTIEPVPADPAASTAVDGNSLLRNAAAPADPDPNNYVKPAKGLSNPLSDYVSSVLKNNRFNPVVDNKRFIPDYLGSVSVSPAASEQYESNASFARPDQLRFGASAGNDDLTKREYGFKRLARIAPILQQNATFFNRNTSNQTSNNSTSAAQGGNLDSGADFSLPIERINVENIIRDMSAELVKPEEITDFGSKFETVLNNLVDRFSGLNTESQIAVATALVTAVFKSYEIIDGQIGNAYLPAGRTKRLGSGGGRQGVGTYYGGPTEPTSLEDFVKVMSDQSMSAKKLHFLNVRATSRPFREAVMRGMQEFFNLEPVSSAKEAVTAHRKIKRPTKNTSHALVVARSIIRSATRMTLMLKEINDAPGLSGDEKTYESVKVIRESRLIGVFNFFAHLGDVGLDNSPGAVPLYDVSVAGLDAGRKISMMDSFSDAYTAGSGNFTAKHGKSRLFQGKVRKLAWAMNQTPDYLLAPGDQYLRTSLGASSGMISKDPTSKMRMETLPELTPRLSNETARSIETLYESEYVPFYFHDVRTNEILGFHAFILSLTEDYTASYEAIEGYGRVEPVKIYKGTQRKIGLSFLVAALDYNDFDTLWYKINKLTSFVYPQFTPGKKLSDPSGQFQFTKPFTQAIGASPLIRIRLGNLFRSNYSKYNLAKIFGLDQPDAVVLGTDRTGQKEIDDRKRKQQQAQQNVSDATAARDKAKKASENYKNDYYNNKYKYLCLCESNDRLDAVVQKSETANNEDSISKKNLKQEAVKQAEKQEPQNVWSVVEDKKVDGNIAITDPTNTYKLVLRVEGILEPDTIFHNTDLQSQNTYNLSPIDPSKVSSLPPDTLLQVTIEKMTLDDYYTEYYGSVDDKIDTTDQQKKDKENNRNDLQKSLQKCHNTYDEEVKKGKEADITKYKFVCQVKYLNPDYMTKASKKQYHQDGAQLIKDEFAAQKLADQAAEQQATTDAAVQEEEKKALAEQGTDPKAHAEKKFLANVDTFMKSENNSIVRSFRSTGGRGLPGFIESLAFDWMTGPWDTDDGRKAPKMCKVTISFSPIHDLTPGLDSSGQNRAPIYPIGPYYSDGN